MPKNVERLCVYYEKVHIFLLLINMKSFGSNSFVIAVAQIKGNSVSERLFCKRFYATALPYGLSNDSSKIRFPFFGVWFPRGGWLAYLCLFAGQNAAAHAANLAFGELC